MRQKLLSTVCRLLKMQCINFETDENNIIGHDEWNRGKYERFTKREDRSAHQPL